MITTGILYLLFAIIEVILTPIYAFDDVVLPTDISNSITQVGHYLGSIDIIIPVSTLLTILGSVVAIDGIIIVYRVINWLIRKIPTIS